MKQINEYYRAKREKIEALNAAFADAKNITGIKYERDPITGEEVVRITDRAFVPHYVLVTANSDDENENEIARFKLNVRPKGYVSDYAVKCRLAKMFNQGREGYNQEGA